MVELNKDMSREEKIKAGITKYLTGERSAMKSFIKSLGEGSELKIIPWHEAMGYFILPCHKDISFALSIYGTDVFECPVCKKVYTVYIDFMLDDEPDNYWPGNSAW